MAVAEPGTGTPPSNTNSCPESSRVPGSHVEAARGRVGSRDREEVVTAIL